MQAKGKKLGQGEVSMKNLNRAHFEVKLQEILQRVLVLQDD